MINWGNFIMNVPMSDVSPSSVTVSDKKLFLSVMDLFKLTLVNFLSDQIYSLSRENENKKLELNYIHVYSKIKVAQYKTKLRSRPTVLL